MPSHREEEQELKDTASNTVQSPAEAQALYTDEDLVLDQHCPIELCVMMAVFCICAIQYTSHKPRVATEHLKCD